MQWEVERLPTRFVVDQDLVERRHQTGGDSSADAGGVHGGKVLGAERGGLTAKDRKSAAILEALNMQR